MQSLDLAFLRNIETWKTTSYLANKLSKHRPTQANRSQLVGGSSSCSWICSRTWTKSLTQIPNNAPTWINKDSTQAMPKPIPDPLTHPIHMMLFYMVTTPQCHHPPTPTPASPTRPRLALRLRRLERRPGAARAAGATGTAGRSAGLGPRAHPIKPWPWSPIQTRDH